MKNHREKVNIYQAEIIFLFTQLMKDEKSGEEIEAFLEEYHGNYTSPAIEEYTNLIRTLAALK